MNFKNILYRIPHYSARMSMPLVQIPEPPVLSGKGMIRRFPEVMAVTGVEKVLIVAGKTVSSSGIMDSFLKALEEYSIDYIVFDGAAPDPTFHNVYDALEMYLENHCDGIVGFGGGSSIDCAKITAAKVTNDKPIEKMEGLFKLNHRLPPFFAIPTTSGSGSEASIGAVITNAETHTKFVIADTRLSPIATVLDPELTVSMPPSLTAGTGMDALTHALEAYLGLYDTNVVREKSLSSSAAILANLEAAYDDGSDLKLRQKMMDAAFDAGAAFTRGMVGNVHAISHALGGFYGLPHGRTNAIVLPHVLDFYLENPIATRKMAELAYNADLGTAAQTDDELARALIEKIRSMNTHMAIPTVVEELDIADIPDLARRVLAEANPSYPVPRIMDYNQCVELFGRLLPEE